MHCNTGLSEGINEGLRNVQRGGFVGLVKRAHEFVFKNCLHVWINKFQWCGKAGTVHHCFSYPPRYKISSASRTFAELVCFLLSMTSSIYCLSPVVVPVPSSQPSIFASRCSPSSVLHSVATSLGGPASLREIKTPWKRKWKLQEGR